jgi:transmembrane sensor
MSESLKQPSLLPKAEAVQIAASEWLERRERGDWSDAVQAEFDVWLAVSPAHTIAYLRLEDVWNRAGRLKALSRPQRASFAFIGRWVSSAKIAAVLAIAALAGFAVYTSQRQPQERVYATDIGQRENLLLADGSQIELNTDTVLRISRGAGPKTVTLEKGEAFFNIKHDANRVFIVKAGDSRVIDLGTKFLVRQNADHVRVALFEGSAKLETAVAGAVARSAVLKPGDVAVASGGAMSVTKKPSDILKDDLAWQHGEVTFHFTSLAEAAAEFNRYNQKKIVVRDAEIARLEIGGTFGMHDVTQFGRLAHHLLGVQVEDKGDRIVLTR